MIKYVCMFILLCFSACAFSDENNEAAAQTNAQLGLTYLNKNMYPAAKNRLLMALQENPKSATGWYSMGYYFEKTNDLKSAKAYYQKAISVEPHSGAAHNNYGTFLCRHGQYQAAIQEFLIATQQPNYLSVADAYENAGLCAIEIPNRTLAMQYFEKAIDNNPNMPYSLFSLAKLNYQNGNMEAAERYFSDFSKIADVTPKQLTQYRIEAFKK